MSEETEPIELLPEEPSGEIPTKLPTVVVLGSGFQKEAPPGGPDRLDQWARMRVLAAGMMFEEGITGLIILTGGKLFDETKSSVAQAMKDYLLMKFPNIPEDSIILEEESTDTSENAAKTLKIMNERKIPGAIILTDEPHLARAESLFRTHGLFKTYGRVRGTASAEVKISARTEHHRKFVERLKESEEFKDFEKRERILRAMLWVDPYGIIPRFGAKWQRRPKGKK